MASHVVTITNVHVNRFTNRLLGICVEWQEVQTSGPGGLLYETAKGHQTVRGSGRSTQEPNRQGDGGSLRRRLGRTL